MSLTPDGWFTFAERFPGPSDKMYSQPNTAQFYVPHSAVGYYAGWLSRLNSQERLPNGRYTDYAAASVHGFIMYDGKVIQHYPITVSCWANGNRRANTRGVAFENEGGYDPHNEPLREPQIASNVRIIEELSAAKGWEPSRPESLIDEDATLYEHNECVTLWGGDATACPSHRMDDLWDTILEAAMTDKEREQLAELVDLMPKVRKDAVEGKNTSARNEQKIDELTAIVGALGERIVGHEDWQELTELTLAALHPEGAPPD